MLLVRLFVRVLRPLAFWPHGDTGCGLPWPDLPSPPPCGWSTGFMAWPRTVGRMPSQRLAPALPYTRRLCSVSYTHLRAHEPPEHIVCRLLLEKKKKIGG